MKTKDRIGYLLYAIAVGFLAVVIYQWIIGVEDTPWEEFGGVLAISAFYAIWLEFQKRKEVKVDV